MHIFIRVQDLIHKFSYLLSSGVCALMNTTLRVYMCEMQVSVHNFILIKWLQLCMFSLVLILMVPFVKVFLISINTHCS